MFKHPSIIIACLLLVILFHSCGNKFQKELNKTYSVTSEQACDEKNGYWYKGKCWSNFKEYDHGIAITEIDSVVQETLEKASEYRIHLGDDAYQVGFFIPEEAKGVTYFIGKFNNGDELNSFLIQFKGKIEELSEFYATATIMEGDIFSEESSSLSEEEMKSRITASGEVKGEKIKVKEREFKFSGNLKNIQTNQPISFKIKLGEGIFGIGDTTLEVKGDKAFLNGTLGARTYQQVSTLIKNHPEVKTIVLEKVPGSINDAVNMHTGRIIRAAGLTTEVTSKSIIASGGVDIFCAGKQRIIAKGAQLGIHSWGGEGISADDLSKDHPAHQYQLEYFTMCLGPKIGPAFYFKTLSSATADDIYWMTQEDLEYWNLATVK